MSRKHFSRSIYPSFPLRHKGWRSFMHAHPLCRITLIHRLQTLCLYPEEPLEEPFQLVGFILECLNAIISPF